MCGFDPQAFAASRRELRLERFLTPVASREASRRAVPDGVSGDLRVFAFGSSMWDPAFRFAKLRRAHAPLHARRIILKDRFGGSSTAASPGMQAALDHGGGCDGLAFGFAAQDGSTETEILSRRETRGAADHATYIPAETVTGAIRALAFTADHGSPAIAGDVPRHEQVRSIATGAGFFGSRLGCLMNIASGLAALGIEDAEGASLMRETADYPGDPHHAALAAPDPTHQPEGTP